MSMLFSKARPKRSKIAISAVIGTLIMFAMLLSIATTYFYVVQQDQTSFQKAANLSNSNLIDDQTKEQFTVCGLANESSELGFYVNNTGIAISIVAYWILNGTSGAAIQYANTTYDNSYHHLPFMVAQDQSGVFPSDYLSPQIIISDSTTYVIKVLTSNGTQGVGTYDFDGGSSGSACQPPTSATVDSLVAGGFGSLQMQFSSFDWYSYSGGPVQQQYNTIVSTQTGCEFMCQTSTSTQTLNNLCANSVQYETNCNSGSYVLDINHPHSGVLVPGGYQPTLTYYTTEYTPTTSTGTTVTTSTGTSKTTTTSTSTGTLALDGTPSTVETTTGASSIQSGTLTTTSTSDVIIVYVSTADTGSNTPPTVSSISNTGGSLTWHSRTSTPTYNYNGGSGYTTYLTEWYATTTSTFSGKITASLSGSFTEEAWITVFAISGVNTGTPFDSNSAVPATNSGSSPSNTISTSNANDALLFSCAPENNNGGIPNGFNTIESSGGSFSHPRDYTGYDIVSSTVSNDQISCGTGADGVQIIDAVQAASSTSTITSTQTTTSTITSTYTSTSTITSTSTSSTSKLYQIPIAFSVNITNDDPSLGTIIINSASNLWVVETCDSGVTEGNCPSGNPFYVFYIMNVNQTTGAITSTTPGSFAQITIPYGVTKTLFYGAAYDMSLPTSTFSPVALTSALSSNPFYFGQFSVFLLFSGTKIVAPTVEVYGQNIPFESTTAADNFGWIYETPTTANPGVATTFSLSVNDSIFAYANPTNLVGVTQVTVNASAFSSVSSTNQNGFTVSYPSTGYITWTASSQSHYITNGTTDTFTWTGTAPSPSASTEYIFPITITWSTGEITTLQSALVATVS